MPEVATDQARITLEQVRAQLLDAAAFGKQLDPAQLENAARKIAYALRVYNSQDSLR